MLLRAQPTEPWTDYDFLLLEAYQIVEDERCPQCGYPTWLCRNEDNDIQFRVRPVTCIASEQRERKEKDYQGDGKSRPYGLSLVAEPYTVSGAPLSGFREKFYEAERARREAIQ